MKPISKGVDYDPRGRKSTENFEVILLRLVDLMQEAEDDDLEDDEYGASVPTKYALDRAVSLLAQAYQAVRNISPLAAVTTTSYEGGIRVQWMYPSANLRLIIPENRNGQEYIYFEADDEYGTEDVSGQNLTKRLMWLQRLE